MAAELAVKVGGSLYDLPNLGGRLRSWLDAQSSRQVLLIPGGGAAADLVRQADALDHLGEERCHWLALRSLQLTAHLLAARLDGGQVIGEIEHRHQAWQKGHIPILDMYAFALEDEARADHLAHQWAVSSDSLAARAAVVARMDELILLKSCDLPAGCDWTEAARRGVVDSALPQVLQDIGRQLKITIVNLRRVA
jgi:5-(aminomethyl)-3-furanmethanol phosphate kinase